jgi:signal transduction histidine kinase/DNA-binding response OmpR family regulator
LKDRYHNNIALLLFIVSASVLFALAIYTSVMMDSISDYLKDNIQERLLSVSKLAAEQISPEELAQLDSPEDVDTPLFGEIRQRLITFAEDNNVIFVYYMRKTDDGRYQFIADNDETEDSVNLTTEPIDSEAAPELASSGTAATSGLESYSIGYVGLLSAFAPVYDEQGEVIAVAGVDISDEQILAMSNLTRNLIILLIVSVLFVVVSGLTNIGLHIRRGRRLRANLGQQRLMSEISQSFISNEPIATLIENALRRTGRFLKVDRCRITVFDKTYGDDRPIYLWLSQEEQQAAEAGAGAKAEAERLRTAPEEHSVASPSSSFEAALGNLFPLTTPNSGAVPTLFCNDTTIAPDARSLALANDYTVFANHALRSFIMAPLYVEGTLWGILSIENRNSTRQWSDNDFQLVSTVSSALVGAIARDLIEKERVEALKRAVFASQAKGDFLSNMSHEMRTPMNAIIGMTTIGLSAEELERKDYCFGRINDASTHLLGIINDVLDISKIEANRLELSYLSFDFRKMIEKAVSVIGFRIDERKLNLRITIDEALPHTLVTDDQRLTQVVANLLSNAVKFTPEGGNIGLSAHLLEERDEQLIIQMAVSDTGIGISPEQKERLFTPFEQAEHGTSRKFGGTGLGLAISKRIIEMMGGKIWVDSELGSGSTFNFTFAARRGKDGEYCYLPSGVDWSTVRMLAVDDAEETRSYFEQIAQQFGVVCDAAADGEEALALIARTQPYDIYFIDWKMPDMDGIELTKRIKARFGQDAIVVIISATEWATIEKEALSAGVNCYLRKPLTPSSIADCLNELFGAKIAQQSAEQEKQLPDLSSYRVLLAEDNEVNREIVLALLKPTGLEIDSVENGREALECISANPKRYDLIFMDVQMPEMDGVEATRRIRALEASEIQALPIIAMTANVFREDVESYLSAGMNDHLGKPLDFSQVIAVLTKWLLPHAKA